MIDVYMAPPEALNQYADPASDATSHEALRSQFDSLLARLPRLKKLFTWPGKIRELSRELQKRVQARYYVVMRHLLDVVSTQDVAQI